MIKNYFIKINSLIQKYGNDITVLYNIKKSNDNFIDIISKKYQKGGTQSTLKMIENMTNDINDNIDKLEIIQRLHTNIYNQLMHILKILREYDNEFKI